MVRRRSAMRQVGDTLVWLAVVLMVAAVVYFTPRFADYVSAVSLKVEGEKLSWHAPTLESGEMVDGTP